jgi:trehalose 2-sulfotransferase
MQPQCSYLICATPRSGSTLLCEALINTGLAGRPQEYFEALKETGLPRRPQDYFSDIDNPEIAGLLGQYSQLDDELPAFANDASYADYLSRVMAQGTTPNGVFGAKLMWGYFADFISYLRDIPHYRTLPVPQLMAAIFPDLHYITVTRRDKVRQAVSLWRAIQTRTWRQEEDILRGHYHHELVFHFEAVDYLVRQIEEHEASWWQYFAENHIHPFKVVYEELTHSYEETAKDILRFLGVRVPAQLPFAERRMKPQADALSEQWVQQYYAAKQEKEQQGA